MRRTTRAGVWLGILIIALVILSALESTIFSFSKTPIDNAQSMETKLADIPMDTDIQHLDNQCANSILAKATPAERAQQSKIPGLLKKITMANIQVIQNDTVENAEKSMVIDIGVFVDAIEEAIDTIGIYPLHTVMMRRQNYAEALNETARELGVRFQARPIHRKGHQATMSYRFLNSLTDRQVLGPFTGHWFWVMHWTGAIMADKLLREGSLLKDSITREYITKPEEYYEMILPLQRAHCPDMLTFHSQHGFIWHYVAKTHQNTPLKEYPVDLALRCCGNLAYDGDEEYIEFLDDGIPRECVHGFGHAIYYAFASQQSQVFDVRLQYRQAANFQLEDQTSHDLVFFCLQARRKFGHRAMRECFGGFGHSEKEMTGSFHTGPNQPYWLLKRGFWRAGIVNFLMWLDDGLFILYGLLFNQQMEHLG